MKRTILCTLILLVPVLGLADSADAIRRGKSRVKADPQSLEAICELADAYTERYTESGGRDEKAALIAVKLAFEARKLNTDAARPHACLARVYLAQGKGAKAKERAVWAIKLDPNDSHAQAVASELGVTATDVEFFFADQSETSTLTKDGLPTTSGDVEAMARKYLPWVIVGAIVLLVCLLGGLFVIYKLIRLVFRMLLYPFRSRPKGAEETP